jgi:hypothetical protein
MLSPDSGPEFLSLLALERMRLIDLAHSWAQSTLKKNVTHLHFYSNFLHKFGIPPHGPFSVTSPPVDPSIPLFWCIEYKAIQRSPRSRTGKVAFNSLRGLRSALASYTFLSTALFCPSDTILDDSRRLLGFSSVSPTDNIASHLVAKGLSVRLGNVTKPSKVLYATHIHWNHSYRLKQLSDPSLSLQQKYSIVAAECVELLGYLGWLRSSECFHLKRGDIRLLAPFDYAAYGFPPGVGAVLLQLLPETKSSRTLQADVVLAWSTSSGLHVGRWMSLLLNLLERLGFNQPTDPLFQNLLSNQVWDSQFYRHQHLFPLLSLQRSAGDPYLSRFDGSPGNGFVDNFTMFHLYRRSGRSHCQRQRTGCCRAATNMEIHTHGRWRMVNRGREPVSVHYYEPSLEDRVYITLLCF